MNARAVVLLACSLFFIVSCAPKTPAPAGGQAGSLAADAKSAFCVNNGLGLYDQPSEGKLSWKQTLALGEKVELQDQSIKAAEPGGTVQREFVRVKTEGGTEGWARADFLVADSLLAVTTADETVIYTQPKNTAATAEVIPGITVLAVSKDTAGQSFLKVSYYGKTLKTGVYVKNEGISTKASDVQSAILLSLARQTDKDTLKKTFLESAKKDYPDSAFISQIESSLSMVADPTAGRAVEDFAATLTVNDNDVNVRSKPHEDSTKVGKLQKGQTVETTQKTTTEYPIGSASAPWFKIKNPEGWVWGGFLE